MPTGRETDVRGLHGTGSSGGFILCTRVGLKNFPMRQISLREKLGRKPRKGWNGGRRYFVARALDRQTHENQESHRMRVSRQPFFHAGVLTSLVSTMLFTGCNNKSAAKATSEPEPASVTLRYRWQ